MGLFISNLLTLIIEKQFRLLLILIREFLVVTVLFTVLSVYFLSQYGTYFIPGFFWLKVIGFGLVWLVKFRGSQRYFFHNMGLSASRLFWSILLLDLFVAIVLILVYHVIA